MPHHQLFRILFGLVVTTLAASSGRAQSEVNKDDTTIDNDLCMECHGDEDIEAESDRGKGLDLHVVPEAFEDSPHLDLSCTECHAGPADFEDVPHNDGKPIALGCKNCHEDEANEYAHSIHGSKQLEGDQEAATCADCHGKHGILPAEDRRSSTNKFRLSVTCAKCHQGGTMLKTHQVGDPKAVEHFVDSIHGRALLVDGLSVAPTCSNCHGVHNILPHENEASKISKANLPDTCGACHVLVEETYAKSVHGRLLAAGHKEGPTCVDCHTSHEISRPLQPEFHLSIDHKCGECHADRLARYRETFHGKAIALGRPGVAACSDCHGHHDILESENPASHISDERRLQTCQKCHPAANENFAGYMVHADHTDKEGSPLLYWSYVFMTALLIGTFAFFAAHTLLWLVRSAVLYLRDSKEFRSQKVREKADDTQYVRFRPIDRFLHALIVLSFLLLVVTGMPLKFYYTDWAKWLLDAMGGQAVAAILHRLGAMITIFYFVVHISNMMFTMWKERRLLVDPSKGRYTLRQFLRVIVGPDSPVPNIQDVRDFWAHQKWFFGRGERPQFDRWTYWEKFDYLAVFWGVVIIGTSGLIMWYPELFTTVLPGWTINIALIVHSDEALLASGFIFTFHFFNVHFRIEKFPMDPVIFSGRVSETELLHERRRLFDRWKAAGELDSHRIKDEWGSWQKIALPAGFLAFVSGVVLVLLIYAAMYSRLAT